MAQKEMGKELVGKKDGSTPLVTAAAKVQSSPRMMSIGAAGICRRHFTLAWVGRRTSAAREDSEKKIHLSGG